MTDVSVQYFSHLNGLQLDNRWGDMIALLDTCLVNGIALPYITDCLVDANGNLALTFDAPHKSLLFQIVEFKNFNPSSLNGKYRIIGVPNTTQLILKASNAILPITIGQSKLAPLGYEIVFTDTNKRVYRALNPNSNHPYIRIDESITDGVNSYTTTYAKSAMIGLLESMSHIDDYENPEVLQLPFDSADLKKNWKITGTSTTVIRGWSKWYWAKGSTAPNNTALEYTTPASGLRNFTLTGDSDAFYLQLSPSNISASKQIMGCGLYNSVLSNDVIPNWFLMSTLKYSQAGNSNSSESIPANQLGAMPLLSNQISNLFFVPRYDLLTPLSSHVSASGIVPNAASGVSNLYVSSAIAALEIPFSSDDGYLRGSLKHLYFSGKSLASNTSSTALLGLNHCFVSDSVHSFISNNNIGGVYYSLGSLE